MRTKFIILVEILTILLLFSTSIVHAQSDKTLTQARPCLDRDKLTFNGVGLFTKETSLSTAFGKPLSIKYFETPKGPYHHKYHMIYYENITIRVYRSEVWGLEITKPGLASKAGVQLLNSLETVENNLGIKFLFDNGKSQNQTLYHYPICGTAMQDYEVELIFKFDQLNKLIQIKLDAYFP